MQGYLYCSCAFSPLLLSLEHEVGNEVESKRAINKLHFLVSLRVAPCWYQVFSSDLP